MAGKLAKSQALTSTVIRALLGLLTAFCRQMTFNFSVYWTKERRRISEKTQKLGFYP